MRVEGGALIFLNKNNQPKKVFAPGRWKDITATQ